MAPVAIQAAIFLLSICPSLFSGDIGRATATSLSFFYNFSDPASLVLDDLYFEGDAYVGNGSVNLASKERLNNGRNRSRAGTGSSSGRVFYRHPVQLWSKAASFSTSFSFVIDGGQSHEGGGLAFFLAAYASRMPLNSGGGHLGHFNSSTTATGGEPIVAVELLDTHGDVGRDQTYASPHIDALSSGKIKIVAHNLGDGVLKVLQVGYSDVDKILIVSLKDSTNGNSATLRTAVDLKMFLPQQVSMGFSADRTSGVSESGVLRVIWWSFNAGPFHAALPTATPVRAALEESANSTATPPHTGTCGCKGNKWKITLAVAGSLIGLALIAVVTFVVYFLRLVCAL